jgi:hypothetical protein
MATTLVKDLVCGMMIDPATAAGKSDHKGEAYYYWCAPGSSRPHIERTSSRTHTPI